EDPRRRARGGVAAPVAGGPGRGAGTGWALARGAARWGATEPLQRFGEQLGHLLVGRRAQQHRLSLQRLVQFGEVEAGGVLEHGGELLGLAQAPAVLRRGGAPAAGGAGRRVRRLG